MLCNFPKPSPEKPSLLMHRDVVLLFHEFGHLVHDIVLKTPYKTFAPLSIAWDFVETPSQILENWVWDKEVLKMISAHYEDKKPLPDEMIESIRKSRLINKGLEVNRSVFLSLYDVQIHTENVSDIQAYYDELRKESLLVKEIEGTSFISSFEHIARTEFGYDAGFYSYLWSRVIAEDMYKEKFANNLFSEEQGLDYRKKVLEQTGKIDENELVKKYLGREFNNTAYLESIGLK